MNSEQSPIPAPLRMARMMGEHHLLVGGGILDQPAAIVTVNYARYLDDLNQRMAGKDFKALDEAEIKMVEKIIDLKRQILSEQ